MWDHSQTARVLRAATATFTQAWEGSVLAASVERLGACTISAVRTSYCFRWLTAEPDPEGIVIDLRKTHTAEPVIGLLETVVEPAGRVWADSPLPSVAETAEAAVARSRTGDVFAALLEPPENETPEDTE